MICSPKEKNIAGQKFNRLTAIKRDFSKKFYQWFFNCECGNVVSVAKASVINGYQVSCGCYNREQKQRQNLTHGLSKHTLYRTWNGMVQRCTIEHNKDYASYGGRGITVCDRWLDVENFIIDMGEKPQRATLDRIDNNKGYHPNNCRWATPLAQGNNKRNNREVVVDGIRFKTLAAAARYFKMPESTLRNRLFNESAKNATARPVVSKNIKHDVGDGRFLTRNEIAAEVGVTAGAIKHRLKKGYLGSDLLSCNISGHPSLATTLLSSRTMHPYIFDQGLIVL